MARRATSLGPKPSLFVFFFVFFPFFALTTKKPGYSPRKGHFCLFLVFLFLSPLAFFGLPLFLFLFLCLSLFFFSFFTPSCLCFLLSFGSLFWSLSLFFFLLSFSFMKGTSIFSLFLVSCLFLFQVPFSYLCYFLILSYVFCSTSRFWFQHKQLKKTQFLVNKGVATKRCFFINLCFAKCQKLSFFLFFFAFFGNFWLMFKKHYKIGISAHF